MRTMLGVLGAAVVVASVFALSACTSAGGNGAGPTTTTAATVSGGLAALYRQRGRLPVFQPVTASEYPAVHVAASPAAPHQGQCTVRVGVAADTLLSVDVTERDPAAQNFADPCPDADAFAAAIIANNEGQAP